MPNVSAVLTIEITGGIEAALPIAIVPFGNEGGASAPPEDVSAVISADLALSGRFTPLPEKDLPSRPHEVSEVRFQDWRRLGSEGLVIGKVINLGGDQYEVSFQLLDVYKAQQLVGRRYKVPAGDLRHLSHQIADLIYETLTGEKGIFTSRIAFVTVAKAANGGKKYALQVADMDGYNPRTILQSKEPILSPAWSPDGAKLAYVSFEQKRSEIFIQELRTGQRQSVAAFPGINGAPDWSPDGRKLAFVSSKDGNPEIYIYSLVDGKLARLTRDAAIDTEPVWAPDGKSIVFTSDRGGQPQLYQVLAVGGQAKRLTFEGTYNASASFAPDGKRIALTHRENKGGQFHIAVLDLGSKNLQVLTQTQMDESPSFAPNGRMILYATAGPQGGALATVSVDRRIHQRLMQQGDEVREPAWSP
ncbi:Tol-Pal system beta propeller repeat-containing protein TolB [Candidatus Nitrosoglobus terrae]|uniref:Tol-Pal system protein TolB n=1 Tax=Candidatus Nitrosoglobus terrae TaxID=1630141 RepID=A0A1Q2SK12_9GAMM|nr:Tol-Pal system beta propeller repeat protein TolB [Candidatus Nitrosoglobus terrae]BAW79471.1 Tol-Pal system beta propeller repeat-containing protein TolB [Candidatus Nitrosoglobus terrae]